MRAKMLPCASGAIVDLRLAQSMQAIVLSHYHQQDRVFTVQFHHAMLGRPTKSVISARIRAPGLSLLNLNEFLKYSDRSFDGNVCSKLGLIA